MKFKAGQKIKQLKDCSGNKKGEIYELHWGHKNGDLKDILFAWNQEATGDGCSCENYWELVEEEKMVCESYTSYELPDRDQRKKWERIKDAFNDLMIEIFN